MFIYKLIFTSLLMFKLHGEQCVSGFTSPKKELEYENRCDLFSISSQNCTSDVFCECNGGRLDCHRLDIFCMKHENDVCLKTGECITYDDEIASTGLCPYYPKHLGWAGYCSVPLKVYQKLPVNLTELTSYFCRDYNREGPLALCGFWNLDFFRDLIPPFCLSSHLSNIHSLYLESLYIIYPLALILVTYIGIELHASNFQPIILLWRPFHKCFSHLRRAWNPKASITNAFSSFFLLTSSRTISTAVRSLHMVILYELHPHSNDNNRRRVLYVDLNASQTLPLIYGFTLAILFLFPTILLCTYPFKCIRALIEYFLSFKSQSALKVFIDTFHGHCKDGTDGSRDFRAVSGLHIFVLLAVTSFEITWNTSLDSQPVIPLVCFAASIFIALIRPYKKSSANVVTSIMFGLTAFYLTVISHTFAEHKHVKALIFFLLTCVLAPHLILIGYIIYQLCLKYYKHIHFCKSKFVNFNNEDAQLLV